MGRIDIRKILASLSTKQRHAIEVVCLSTSCTYQMAYDMLVAEEWDIDEAVIDVYNAFEFAQVDTEKLLGVVSKQVQQDMHKKVIASILITDVVMEAKGITPTSEDYIKAINKDFEV
jgi:signal transduction protein with GAF and PtsI domain